MNIKLFGYTFGSSTKEISGISQYVTPSFTEPSVDIHSGGFMSPTATSLQLTTVVKTENDAITQYRDVARQPEVDLAIEEIICEMIVFDHQKPAVSLNMDSTKLPVSIKDRINEEFTTILGLLDFNYTAHNMAKRWYIDGRINYLVSIDENNPQLGIQQLQYIDPYKIKRIRDINRGMKNGHPIVSSIREYYLYNEGGIDNNTNSSTVTNSTMTLTTESVIHCNSGLYDPDRGFMISAMDSAIRTVNSLRMVEESGIIYMMTRAPERRVFYIDVGNVSKARVEEYIKEIADKHRTKILYDPVTGKVRNEKRLMAMTEDFWIPRQGGSRGTEIQTLPGGTSFDNTPQLDYFKTQLWDALKVPSSRFQQGSVYTHGTEITSGELRFFKYVQKLRMQFSKLFVELLKRQLVLKGVMSLEDFEDFKDNLHFTYTVDNYFAEAVETEIWQARFNNLNTAFPFLGQLFGSEFVYEKILHITEEEAEKLKLDAANWADMTTQTQARQQMLAQQLEAENTAKLTQILQQQGIVYPPVQDAPQ